MWEKRTKNLQRRKISQQLQEHNITAVQRVVQVSGISATSSNSDYGRHDRLCVRPLDSCVDKRYFFQRHQFKFSNPSHWLNPSNENCKASSVNFCHWKATHAFNEPWKNIWIWIIIYKNRNCPYTTTYSRGIASSLFNNITVLYIVTRIMVSRWRRVLRSRFVVFSEWTGERVSERERDEGNQRVRGGIATQQARLVRVGQCVAVVHVESVPPRDLANGPLWFLHSSSAPTVGSTSCFFYFTSISITNAFSHSNHMYSSPSLISLNYFSLLFFSRFLSPFKSWT